MLPSPLHPQTKHQPLCLPKGVHGASVIHPLTWQATILIRPVSTVIKEVAAKLRTDAFPTLAEEFILLMAAAPGPGGWQV